jgi:hypothetical protein
MIRAILACTASPLSHLLYVRRKGAENSKNIDAIRMQNTSAQSTLWVHCDENRVIEYLVQGSDWVTLSLTVGAYLK